MMRITQLKANQSLIETTEYTAHLSYGVPQVIVFHRGSAYSIAQQCKVLEYYQQA